MKIEADDWETWKANRVTEAVFKMFEEQARKAKAAWVETSWDSGQANPVTLASLRSRAEVFEQLQQMTKEQVEEDNGYDEADQRG